MPKIPQYFFTGKLTPSDIGFQGFETAARRIGSSAEQAAAGQKEIGADIAKLWDVGGRVFGEAFKGGGGGVGVRGGGGSSRTLISTGSAEFGYANARANAQNQAAENKFNAAAHREISRAAPKLVNAATAATSLISPTPSAQSPFSAPSVIRGDQPPTGLTNPTADQAAQTDLNPSRLGPVGAILRPGEAPQVTSYPSPRGAEIDLPFGMRADKLGPGAIGREVLSGSIGPSTITRPLPGAANAGDGVTPEILRREKVLDKPIETSVSPAIARVDDQGRPSTTVSVPQTVTDIPPATDQSIQAQAPTPDIPSTTPGDTGVWQSIVSMFAPSPTSGVTSIDTAETPSTSNVTNPIYPEQ